MKRIFEHVPEPEDYARVPQYEHREVERDGAIVEEVFQLSPEEIISRAKCAPSPESADMSGTIYPSPDYKDDFQRIDELEKQVDIIEIKSK